MERARSNTYRPTQSLASLKEDTQGDRSIVLLISTGRDQLMAAPYSLIKRTLMVTVMFGFTVVVGLAADQTSASEVTEPLSPLQPPFKA